MSKVNTPDACPERFVYAGYSAENTTEEEAISELEALEDYSYWVRNSVLPYESSVAVDGKRKSGTVDEHRSCGVDVLVARSDSGVTMSVGMMADPLDGNVVLCMIIRFVRENGIADELVNYNVVGYPEVVDGIRKKLACGEW